MAISIVLVFLSTIISVFAATATVEWGSGILAHSEGDACPTDYPGGILNPDSANFLCCLTSTASDTTYIGATPSTNAAGLVGCCTISAVCTGNPGHYLDWSEDIDSSIHYQSHTDAPIAPSAADNSPAITQAPAITPAPAANSGLSTPPAPSGATSSGTTSGEGAAAYTTIGGIPFYYAPTSITNNQCAIGSGSNNNQNCGPGAQSVNSGNKVSDGGIAGIVIGVVSVLIAALGVWYARKNNLFQKAVVKMKVPGETENVKIAV